MNRKPLYFMLVILVNLIIFSTQSILAMEVPPPTGSNAYIQTSGRDTDLGIGDYYSREDPGNPSIPHEFKLYVSCDATDPVVVGLFDPENYLTAWGDGPGAVDEPRNNTGGNSTTPADFDIANFRITHAGGLDHSVAYPPVATTHLSWTEFIRIDPTVECGEFTLTTWQSRADANPVNDDNSWRVKLFYDDVACAGATCTSTEIANATNEGSIIDGTQLSIGVTRTTYQHGTTGTPPTCQIFRFYIGEPLVGQNITLRNFDLDNPGTGGGVRYFSPADPAAVITPPATGPVPSNGRVGAISPDATWAQNIYPVTSADVGWWRAYYCVNGNNQYIFEAPQTIPVFFDPPPASPDMTVTKDDGRTVVSSNGEQVVYTINYQNTGGGGAVDVIIEDQLPTGATFVSCTGGCTGVGPVTWDIGTVPAGASGSVQLTVNLPASPGGTTHTNTVTLNYKDVVLNPFPVETDTDIDTVAPPPQLTVSKDDGRTVVSSNGEQVVYTINYQNTGTGGAVNVVIEDQLPIGATFVSCTAGCAGVGPVTWNIGAVGAGVSGSVQLTVDLPASPAGTTHVNTVTLNYSDVALSPFPPVSDTDIDTVAAAPQLTVSKDDGRTVVSSNGEQVVYTINYQNTGVGDAVNVVIEDQLPAGATFVSCTAGCAGIGPVVTWNIGAVGAGVSGSVQLTVNLPASPAGTNHTNTVTLNYSDVALSPFPPVSDTDIDTVVAPPQLTVSKDDGRTLVSSNGEQVVYTINYQNTGIGDAVNVVIEDQLPAGATFVSCTAGCAGVGPVTWNIGSVPAGVSGSVQLTVDLPASPTGTTHTNTVTLNYSDVALSPFPPVSDTDIDTVANSPQLTISKDDGRTLVSSNGEQVVYTINYQNTGAGGAVNVVIVDQLPAGATFVSCTAGCIGVGPVTWNIGAVATGASGSVQLTVDLPASPAGTTHTNTVTLNYDDEFLQPFPPVSDTDIDTVAPPPQLTVSKDDGRTLVSSNGEQIVYTINYQNTGTGGAVNVVIEDQLPAGSTFVSCTAGCAGVGPVTWNIGAVAAGASGSVELTLDLPASPVGTTHTNTVTLNYDDEFLQPFPPVTDTDVDTVADLPLLTISKDDGRTLVSSNGEQVVYTINYQNTGSGEAVSVVIEDQLPAGTTFVSCTAGCAGAGPVIWNIGSVPAGVSGSVELTLDLPASPIGTTYTNTVTLNYNDTSLNPFPPVTDTDIDTVSDLPLLTISKDDGQTTVSSNGEEVTYTIVVENIGNATAHNVLVTDTLPTGSTFLSCSNGCTSVTPNAEYIWGPGLTLNQGDSLNLTIQVRLPSATVNSQHVNTVRATYTDLNNVPLTPVDDDDIDVVVAAPPATLVPTATLPPQTAVPNTPSSTQQPAIEIIDPFITKNANPPFAMPGEAVTWTIVVRNPGTIAFADVRVEDAMPAEVEILSVQATSGAIRSEGQRVIFTQSTLDAGATITITISTRVRNTASVPYVIKNLACLSYAGSSGTNCADAQVISVNSLPETGETPLIPPLYILVGGSLLLLGLTVVGVTRRLR